MSRGDQKLQTRQRIAEAAGRTFRKSGFNGAGVDGLAKAAGVSASTVSRTITNQATISEATKKKVRKAMMELGYVPPKQKQTVSSGTFHDTRISGGAAVPQGAAFRRIGIVLPPVQSKMQENSFFLNITITKKQKNIWIVALL